MSAWDALLWLVVALFALMVLGAAFLFAWFVVDTLRGDQ